MEAMNQAIGPDDSVFTRITRYQVLSECVDLLRGMQRSISRDGAMQQPQRGFELAFAATGRKIEILQEMMREERFGKEGAAG